MAPARLYIGNLPMDIKESELDDLFHKYGRIKDIQIKNDRKPPAFAFITFSDERDADDAVRGRDRYRFADRSLRVEFAKGERRGNSRDRSRSRSGSRDRRRHRSRERTYTLNKAAQQKIEYGIIVSGLPKFCSWQDLKDFGRKIGHVEYSDIMGNGEGLLNFSNSNALEDALNSSKDTKFTFRGDSYTVSVKKALDDPRFMSKKKEEYKERARSGSRSGSRSRSRSPNRSNSRSHDRDNTTPPPSDREDDRREDRD